MNCKLEFPNSIQIFSDQAMKIIIKQSWLSKNNEKTKFKIKTKEKKINLKP